MAKDNTITWVTVNNIVPIIASAVMIAGSFFTLSNKLDLQAQKIDGLIETTKGIATDVKEDNNKINNHEVRITLLEDRKQTKTSSASLISKASTVSSTPSPVKEDQITVNYSIQNETKEVSSTPQPSVLPVATEPTPQSSAVENLVNDLLHVIN